MPQQEGSDHRAWIAGWVAKRMRELGMGPAELGRRVGASSQRLSQVTAGVKVPGLNLLWRIATVFEEEEEYAAMSDAQIREKLDRLIVSLKPRRLMYLASLSSSTAQALVDAHELRESGRARIEGRFPPDIESN